MNAGIPVSRASVLTSAGASVTPSAARVSDNWRVPSLTADSVSPAGSAAGLQDFAGGSALPPAGTARRPGFPGPGRREDFTEGGHPAMAPGAAGEPAGSGQMPGRLLPLSPVPATAALMPGRARPRAVRGSRPGSAVGLANAAWPAPDRRGHPRNRGPALGHALPGTCTHACEGGRWHA